MKLKDKALAAFFLALLLFLTLLHACVTVQVVSHGQAVQDQVQVDKAQEVNGVKVQPPLDSVNN